jgi:hypothetical protein
MKMINLPLCYVFLKSRVKYVEKGFENRFDVPKKLFIENCEIMSFRREVNISILIDM